MVGGVRVGGVPRINGGFDVVRAGVVFGVVAVDAVGEA